MTSIRVCGGLFPETLTCDYNIHSFTSFDLRYWLCKPSTDIRVLQLWRNITSDYWQFSIKSDFYKIITKIFSLIIKLQMNLNRLDSNLINQKTCVQQFNQLTTISQTFNDT